MNAHAQRRLEDLLDREIETARRLAGVLSTERAALTGHQADAVHQMADDKTCLFAEIEALELERRSLWDSPGSGGRGMAATVADRWRQLLELIAGCRSANEVNGHIIHIRQNQIRQLIDIVRGGAPMTYGRQGKTCSRALRALARA
jgi:flagellar biosynthesis/type III secretory pathway chaperone